MDQFKEGECSHSPSLFKKQLQCLEYIQHRGSSQNRLKIAREPGIVLGKKKG